MITGFQLGFGEGGRETPRCGIAVLRGPSTRAFGAASSRRDIAEHAKCPTAARHFPSSPLFASAFCFAFQ